MVRQRRYKKDRLKHLRERYLKSETVCEFAKNEVNISDNIQQKPALKRKRVIRNAQTGTRTERM